MKITRIAFIFFGLVLASHMNASAGTLGHGLARHIDELKPTDLVSVWITVNDDHEAISFKSKIVDRAETRADRHRLAMTDLQDRTHTQESLLELLQELETAGRARNVKGHWIVNVVEAEVAARELEILSHRSDVNMITLEPEIKVASLSGKGQTVVTPADATSVDSNLDYVNAPTAWTAGYTGEGRLVCSFDSGVEGSHPSLADSWKGLDGDSSAAWFDQLDGELFPHTFSEAGSARGHGTHVMGIMVGHSEAGSDTTGVAPGAKWIAAGVINLGIGLSVLDAFEWAADPDGNPNTVDDVPDVINHSWYIPNANCINTVYDAIDNTEALGIVNILVAGNSVLPPPQPIENPGDRATDSIDCFAVGNLNHTTNTIDYNSCRGPSPCDFTKFKPNVVAPGTMIRSANYTGGDTTLSGTSMAAPHVSGLVALLRQKNPDVTVEEIKLAILNSTQRPIGFGTIPNNNFGWGAIDCMAALDLIDLVSDTPHVRVYDFNHDQINPGDTVTGTVLLQNIGADVDNVTGALLQSNEAIEVITSGINFGSIATGDTLRSIDSVTVVLSDSVTVGSILSVDLQIDGTGFTTTVPLFFIIEPPLQRTVATHDVGRIEFSLSNFGVYGMAPGSRFQLGGAGFSFDGSFNEFYEAGLIIGNHVSRISSTVHSHLDEPDLDFSVAPGGNMEFMEPGPASAQQTRCAFNDSRADEPYGLEITQESYALTPPNDDYIILRYILNNTSPSTISDLHFGLFLDWDVVAYRENAGGYESTDGFAWVARNSGTTGSPILSNYRGVRMSEGTATTTAVVKTSQYDLDFEDYQKYAILTSGSLYADANKTAKDDLFVVLGTGPLTIPSNGRDTISFALLAGNTFADIQDASTRATTIPTDVPETPPTSAPLPDDFALYQNYPNPFNPSTVISFEMPYKGDYDFTVFNMLGRVVQQQTGSAKRGLVEIEFDGSSYASGAYFYRVSIGDRSIARKMLLLK